MGTDRIMRTTAQETGISRAPGLRLFSEPMTLQLGRDVMVKSRPRDFLTRSEGQLKRGPAIGWVGLLGMHWKCVPLTEAERARHFAA